ncbi:MAG: galactose ABC transporter substrate-binding protein [Oscillospiraceae bacterium]|nr:galactose ABC transporter substrate-binding protein [Oscillospiraceae bacterium]
MKKLLAVLLALFMFVSLTACKGNDNGDTGNTGVDTGVDTGADTQAGGAIKVDVFWYTFADTYLTSVRNAMESQFNSVSNISYMMHDCQEDQAKQTELVQSAITQGTNLLVVNIVTTGSEEAAMNIVNLAKAADLPIVFFNREVSDAVVNSYAKCAFVGTDADEAGFMQGEAIASFLLEGDNLSKYDLNGDGEISYIMFRGEHGNAEAFGRTKYSVQQANELLATSGVKLVPSRANETSNQYDDDGISNYFLYGNWSAANAADLMRTALTANSLTDGSIELIIANNDDQAIGAIEAMNEQGFNTGADAVGYIPVFGVDATSVAQEAINGGRMTGTILQDGPAMAACIVLLAKNIAGDLDLMAGTSGYNIDSGVNKIRIPYAIVSGSSPNIATPPVAAGPIKVDIFWYTFADTYLTSVRNAMEAQLSANPNLIATHFDCQEDQGRQTDMVQSSITQGVDLLIVNIVTTGSEEAAMNIVNMAKDAGIPIIFFNREVSDAVVNSYEKCAFVGTDADEAGYMQGQAIANFLLMGDNLSKYDLNSDGEISYIMFRGEHGNAEAFGRTKYSVQEANRLLAGQAKLVPSRANETSNQYEDDGISNFFLYGNWSAANAADLMRTALTANSLTDGSIELIIANNDDQAIGAIEAMNEQGFNTGSGSNYIPVFGVDATSVAQEAINAGKMTATILQDAEGMAAYILALANNVAAGADLLANTGGYNIDAGVAKIRVPYAIFG